MLNKYIWMFNYFYRRNPHHFTNKLQMSLVCRFSRNNSIKNKYIIYLKTHLLQVYFELFA